MTVPNDGPITAVSSWQAVPAVRQRDSRHDEPRSESRVGFRCPFCQSRDLPVEQSKISTAGWITFVLFLLFFCPLCWIGLLMKESYRVCGSCGMKLG
jgi:hypothetical protein